MKTLEELRTAIYNKIEEINSMVISDIEFLDEDGAYNPEKLEEYLEASKKKNYARATCMRMNSNLMKRIYGEWTFRDKNYSTYVYEFRRFAC